MNDRVSIRGVRADASHGVYDFEKTERHPFVVDVDAEIAPGAGITDDVAHTISYGDLARDAVAVITGERVDLIETLAERVAERVLARGARAVTVTVHKPEAPVGLPFDDASVTIRRRAGIQRSGVIRSVVLALGANLGEPSIMLQWAVEQISDLDVHVDAVSRFVETEPVLAPGQAPQPPYTNAVVRLTTAMAPLELLHHLQAIEVRGGRVRHERWGARTLDIDIIAVEGVESADPELTLPHPRAHERLFVLGPWAQIEPDATLGAERVSDLAEALR